MVFMRSLCTCPMPKSWHFAPSQAPARKNSREQKKVEGHLGCACKVRPSRMFLKRHGQGCLLIILLILNLGIFFGHSSKEARIQKGIAGDSKMADDQPRVCQSRRLAGGNANVPSTLTARTVSRKPVPPLTMQSFTNTSLP